MKKLLFILLLLGAASCTKYEPDTLDAKKDDPKKTEIIITNGPKNIVK